MVEDSLEWLNEEWRRGDKRRKYKGEGGLTARHGHLPV